LRDATNENLEIMQKLERRVRRLLGGTMYTIHYPFHYIKMANQEGCELYFHETKTLAQREKLHKARKLPNDAKLHC